MQSRLESVIEQVLNVGSGYCIALLLTVTIFPALGYYISASQALGVTAIYTAVSVARGYLWRRYFNRRLVRRLMGD